MSKQIPPHIKINTIERLSVSRKCLNCGAVYNNETDDRETARKGTGLFVAEHKKCKGVVGG